MAKERPKIENALGGFTNQIIQGSLQHIYAFEVDVKTRAAARGIYMQHAGLHHELCAQKANACGQYAAVSAQTSMHVQCGPFKIAAHAADLDTPEREVTLAFHAAG